MNRVRLGMRLVSLVRKVALIWPDVKTFYVLTVNLLSNLDQKSKFQLNKMIEIIIKQIAIHAWSSRCQ